MRTSARLVSVTLAALLSLPAAVRAEGNDPKRTVAVLEFRGGSAAVPDIGRRSAALLRDKTSLNVLDLDDARGRAGVKLDSKVAACDGDAACIAALGQALQADEIILLGVSEFGDVILTLQRIDVASRDVVSRVAEALPPGKNPDDGQLLDYLRRVLPRTDFLRFGTLRIEANVEGAEVVVGTRSRGTTPLAPLKVRAPATYEIAVDKPGYLGFRASVEVPPDAVVQVRPVLTPDRRAWYAKWWVVAIAGTVAVAAIAVAVIATRDEPTELPVVIPPFDPGPGGFGFRF